MNFEQNVQLRFHFKFLLDPSGKLQEILFHMTWWWDSFRFRWVMDEAVTEDSYSRNDDGMWFLWAGWGDFHVCSWEGAGAWLDLAASSLVWFSLSAVASQKRNVTHCTASWKISIVEDHEKVKNVSIYSFVISTTC